jgi:hypothetical protein
VIYADVCWGLALYLQMAYKKCTIFDFFFNFFQFFSEKKSVLGYINILCGEDDGSMMGWTKWLLKDPWARSGMVMVMEPHTAASLVKDGKNMDESKERKPRRRTATVTSIRTLSRIA